MTHVTAQQTTVLILCAGDGTRWDEYLDIPKQLASFNGEAILHRMVRLLRSQGYGDITVVANDERLRLPEVGFFAPPNYRWTVETLLSTRPLWTDRTLVLLGDVFFTEEAMATITGTGTGVHVCGRPGFNRYTLRPYGEAFALFFDRQNQRRLLESIAIALRDAQSGGRGKFWELYRSLCHYPLQQHKVDRKVFIRIEDATDDIDEPAEYESLADLYTQISSDRRFRSIRVSYSLARLRVAKAALDMLAMIREIKVAVPGPIKKPIKRILGHRNAQR